MKSTQGLQNYGYKTQSLPEENRLEKERSEAKAHSPRVSNLAS